MQSFDASLRIQTQNAACFHALTTALCANAGMASALPPFQLPAVPIIPTLSLDEEDNGERNGAQVNVKDGDVPGGQ